MLKEFSELCSVLIPVSGSYFMSTLSWFDPVSVGATAKTSESDNKDNFVAEGGGRSPRIVQW